jgi:hypothetical protein
MPRECTSMGSLHMVKHGTLWVFSWQSQLFIQTQRWSMVPCESSVDSLSCSYRLKGIYIYPEASQEVHNWQLYTIIWLIIHSRCTCISVFCIHQFKNTKRSPNYMWEGNTCSHYISILFQLSLLFDSISIGYISRWTQTVCRHYDLA